MVLNETEYEMYIDQKVKNLIQDETARIIDGRRKYVDWADAYSILKEEIEETAEEVGRLNDSLEKYWKLVRTDAPELAFIERLMVIALCAERTIHEAKQVGAVAKKAIEQLEQRSESINVSAYMFQEASNRYKKAPVTDQSKQELRK